MSPLLIISSETLTKIIISGFNEELARLELKSPDTAPLQNSDGDHFSCAQLLITCKTLHARKNGVVTYAVDYFISFLKGSKGIPQGKVLFLIPHKYRKSVIKQFIINQQKQLGKLGEISFSRCPNNVHEALDKLTLGFNEIVYEIKTTQVTLNTVAEWLIEEFCKNVGKESMGPDCFTNKAAIKITFEHRIFPNFFKTLNYLLSSKKINKTRSTINPGYLNIETFIYEKLKSVSGCYDNDLTFLINQTESFKEVETEPAPLEDAFLINKLLSIYCDAHWHHNAQPLTKDSQPSDTLPIKSPIKVQKERPLYKIWIKRAIKTLLLVGTLVIIFKTIRLFHFLPTFFKAIFLKIKG